MGESLHLLALAALAFAGLIAFLISRDWVKTLDAKILGRVAMLSLAMSERAQKKTLTAMRDITALGGDMFSLITLICGLFILAGRDDNYALGVFAFLMIGARVLGLILKKIFSRERPPTAYQATDTYTSSFPSIHTCMSFVSAFAISGMLISANDPATDGAQSHFCNALAIGAGFSALLGFTRAYLQVHWPTDILAGWLLGLSACLIAVPFI